jgi:oligopeptidase B
LRFSAPDSASPGCCRAPTQRVLHGVTLHDPYAWLRADNWQEVMRKPETVLSDIRAYLEAENAYAQSALEPLEALKDKLKAKCAGASRKMMPPCRRLMGPMPTACATARVANIRSSCARRAMAVQEDVLLDGDALAEGKAYFKFGAANTAMIMRLLAWSADDKGSEKYTLRIRDLETGDDLPDTDRGNERAAVSGRLMARPCTTPGLMTIIAHRKGVPPHRRLRPTPTG